MENFAPTSFNCITYSIRTSAVPTAPSALSPAAFWVTLTERETKSYESFIHLLCSLTGDGPLGSEVMKLLLCMQPRDLRWSKISCQSFRLSSPTP